MAQMAIDQCLAEYLCCVAADAIAGGKRNDDSSRGMAAGEKVRGAARYGARQQRQSAVQEHDAREPLLLAQRSSARNGAYACLAVMSRCRNASRQAKNRGKTPHANHGEKRRRSASRKRAAVTAV